MANPGKPRQTHEKVEDRQVTDRGIAFQAVRVSPFDSLHSSPLRLANLCVQPWLSEYGKAMPPAYHRSVPTPSTTNARPRLAITIGTHSLTDFFSFILIALMPILMTRLDLSPAQVAGLLAVGSIASGFIQPLTALFSDKFDSRMIGPAGLAAAAIAVGFIGHAQTYWHLLLIQIIGTAGIGAFHPVAAAAVGQLSGSKRSRGIAVFFLAGMIGGFTGNVTAPLWVGFFSGRRLIEGEPSIAYGLQTLSWFIVPGILGAAALAWAIHAVPHRRHDAHELHSSLAEDQRRQRWLAVGLLYLGNVIRFTVNMALVFLIIAWTEQLTLARAGAAQLTDALSVDAATMNGPLQGAMQIGMGGAGLFAGWFLRSHHEKLALVMVPCLGAAAIAIFPYAQRLESLAVPAAFVMSVLAGVGFGGLVPVTISLAQRLLPHRTSLASGLMLGGAWAFAAVGPPLANGLINGLGLTNAFAAVGGLLLIAGLISAAIPSQALRETAHH